MTAPDGGEGPGERHPDDDPETDPLRLPEYAAQAAVALTEAERRPTLSAGGRVRLEALLTDPDAPVWTHTAGDRLDAEAVARAGVPRPTDGWLEEHLASVRALPAYRHHPGPLRELDQVAYLRFASVYRQFRSVDDFESEIALLRAEGEPAGIEPLIPDPLLDSKVASFTPHRLTPRRRPAGGGGPPPP